LPGFFIRQNLNFPCPGHAPDRESSALLVTNFSASLLPKVMYSCCQKLCIPIYQKLCIVIYRLHGIALVRLIEGKYLYETKSFYKQNNYIPKDLPKYVGEYIYDKKGDNYTVYNIQEGWIDGLKEFILK
jgi:hypothetical protein